MLAPYITKQMEYKANKVSSVSSSSSSSDTESFMHNPKDHIELEKRFSFTEPLLTATTVNTNQNNRYLQMDAPPEQQRVTRDTNRPIEYGEVSTHART